VKRGEARAEHREGSPYNEPLGALRAVPDASGVLEPAEYDDEHDRHQDDDGDREGVVGSVVHFFFFGPASP
jgi:hypothetical protein